MAGGLPRGGGESPEQVEGGLQEGGVSGDNETVIRVEDGGNDADVDGAKARLFHLEDPLLNDGVHHRVKDGGREGAALGDAAL